MVTKKQLRELSNYKNEFKDLSRWLFAVEIKRGFFPIVKLKRLGLIKNYVKKKGKKVGGTIVGKREYFVLTDKGKRHLNLLTGLGY